MKPEKQRIAIAEACGWVIKTEQVEHTNGYQWTETRKFWVSPHGKRGELPDYLNDLNAMAEAIATLGYDKQQDWLNKLSYVLGFKSRNNWVLSDLVNATAAQRAEAFLKTIGKWEDDK